MTAILVSRFSIQRCLLALLTLAIAHTNADEECIKSECPGPLYYYKTLGCTPVYEKEGDCCPVRYNCDHLKGRSTKKCYVNGEEYSIGDVLKEEHRNPCDMACTCREGHDGVASFVCAIIDCFHGHLEPNCYLRGSPTKCCGEIVCVEKPEDRINCTVDDKVYKDGEYFKPKSDPELNCNCMEGYKGENVEPFCAKPKRPYCAPDFRHASELHNHCAPVFYSDQSPQTNCNLATRCQNTDDVVIHNHDTTRSNEHLDDEKNQCQFGNLKMHLGDELNMGTDYSSVCVKCVCEVPPVPTCQRLSDEECNVSKHKPFDNVQYVSVVESKE